MVDKALFSSDSQEWETPDDLFEELDTEHNFNLDPCATEENTKCDAFYSKEDDGLKQDWNLAMPCYDEDGHYWVKIIPGRVFVNPPYGRNSVGKWVEKAIEEVENNNAELVVMLLPVRTCTKWFHDYIMPKANHILFIKGRIKFKGASNSAPFPSMIAVFKGFKDSE